MERCGRGHQVSPQHQKDRTPAPRQERTQRRKIYAAAKVSARLDQAGSFLLSEVIKPSDSRHLARLKGTYWFPKCRWVDGTFWSPKSHRAEGTVSVRVPRNHFREPLIQAQAKARTTLAELSLVTGPFCARRDYSQNIRKSEGKDMSADEKVSKQDHLPFPPTPSTSVGGVGGSVILSLFPVTYSTRTCSIAPARGDDRKTLSTLNRC
jgi:hypothetical protein